jgi:flagellar hook-length control protein FliK
VFDFTLTGVGAAEGLGATKPGAGLPMALGSAAAPDGADAEALAAAFRHLVDALADRVPSGETTDIGPEPLGEAPALAAAPVLFAWPEDPAAESAGMEPARTGLSHPAFAGVMDPLDQDPLASTPTVVGTIVWVAPVVAADPLPDGASVAALAGGPLAGGSGEGSAERPLAPSSADAPAGRALLGASQAASVPDAPAPVPSTIGGDPNGGLETNTDSPRQDHTVPRAMRGATETEVATDTEQVLTSRAGRDEPLRADRPSAGDAGARVEAGNRAPADGVDAAPHTFGPARGSRTTSPRATARAPRHALPIAPLDHASTGAAVNAGHTDASAAAVRLTASEGQFLFDGRVPGPTRLNSETASQKDRAAAPTPASRASTASIRGTEKTPPILSPSFQPFAGAKPPEPAALAGRTLAAVDLSIGIVPAQGHQLGAPAAAAPVQGTARPEFGSAPDGTTVDQIVQAIRLVWSRGIGEATIRLEPRHFGDLSVSLRVEQGHVALRLTAEVAAVRDWLQTNQAALRQGLADQHLTLDRLEVAPSESGRHESARRDRQDERQPADERPARRQGKPDAEAFFEVVA